MVQNEQQPPVSVLDGVELMVRNGVPEGWYSAPQALGHRYLLIIISIGKLAWCIFQASIVISRETVGPSAPRFRFHGGWKDDAASGLLHMDERRIARYPQLLRLEIIGDQGGAPVCCFGEYNFRRTVWIARHALHRS